MLDDRSSDEAKKNVQENAYVKLLYTRFQLYDIISLIMEDIQKQPQSILHSLQSQGTGVKLFSPAILIAAAIVILSGITTGFLFSRNNTSKTLPAGVNISTENIKKGQAYGSEDTKTFRDAVEGKLEKGGVFEEGSHKLIRPGGDSQTVALTSSLIDLDQFVSRKVKVWGETQKSEKAGWLMDVGRLEVLE